MVESCREMAAIHIAKEVSTKAVQCHRRSLLQRVFHFNYSTKLRESQHASADFGFENKKALEACRFYSEVTKRYLKLVDVIPCAN